MSKQWAPEPWIMALPKANGSFDENAEEWQKQLLDANGNKIMQWDYDDGWHLPRETEHRIAACVSACAGVPTEDLVEMTKGTVDHECPTCGRVARVYPIPEGRHRWLKCFRCGVSSRQMRVYQ